MTIRAYRTHFIQELSSIYEEGEAESFFYFPDGPRCHCTLSSLVSLTKIALLIDKLAKSNAQKIVLLHSEHK